MGNLVTSGKIEGKRSRHRRRQKLQDSLASWHLFMKTSLDATTLKSQGQVLYACDNHFSLWAISLKRKTKPEVVFCWLFHASSKY